RGPGQEYAESRMELQYGDLYRGFIPSARMVPPGIEYFIEGRTRGGDRVPLFMTAKKPARVIVLSQESAAAAEEPAPPPPSKKKKKRVEEEEEKKPERFPKAEKFE